MALLPLAVGVLVCATVALATPPGETVPHDTPIRFVPATAGGLVSLGIYDREGALVRVLCDEWPFSRFRIGLNGLSTSWDGNDDAGQSVVAGTYTARGFIVGDITVSGEAFHFNDWIEAADSPRIVSVEATQVLPGSDTLVLARLAGGRGALVRYSPESEARWQTMVTEPRTAMAHAIHLGAGNHVAFALFDGTLRGIGLADGAEVPLPVKTDGIVAVSARGDRLALLDAEAVRFYSLPSFDSQGEASGLPSPLASLALLDQGAVAAGEDGSVWRWQTSWSKVEMPTGAQVRTVSSGRNNTFWVLEERADGSTCVAQYGAEEGRLAEWSPPADGGNITSLSTAPEEDYFLATLAVPDGQRTVAIRRKDGGGGWEYVFDKKITDSSGFGWRDGTLVASGGEIPAEVMVRQVENPLDPGASRRLVLRATPDETGAVLGTTDGLPLLRVSTGTEDNRVMIVPGGEENTARFFQGDGACVEEYALSNLGAITSFDAGIVKMSGGQETSPPPFEVETTP